MEVTRTERGFEWVNFVDAYDKSCHLAQSSVIFDDSLDRPGSSAVWLGRSTDGGMHLSREMVKELADRLLAWLATGSLELPATLEDQPCTASVEE